MYGLPPYCTRRGVSAWSKIAPPREYAFRRSSIYAAFGDKQALFSLAVKRYTETRAQYATNALEEPTIEKAVRALFDSTVKFLTTPGHPPTCMTLAGAAGCSVDATQARDITTEIRKQNEAAMRERFLKARKKRRVAQRRQCRRLYPVSLLDPRRSIHPDNELPRWPFAIWVTETCCGRCSKLADDSQVGGRGVAVSKNRKRPP
jgi:hypothetical protein